MKGQECRGIGNLKRKIILREKSREVSAVQIEQLDFPTRELHLGSALRLQKLKRLNNKTASILAISSKRSGSLNYSMKSPQSTTP